MATGRIKNWAEFQHYKDRAPPWIKLHRSFLDDFDFARLPVASKALAPMIWLLAAESKDGTVCVDHDWLSFRLRWPVEEIVAGLKPLCDAGFVILDSEALADRLQGACLEGETEAEAEAEGEKGASKAPTPSKAKKTKAKESTLDQWVSGLGDEAAIATDDPIFKWASDTGISTEWIELAWWAFEGRYAGNEKTYTDWRAVFRKAVREDWLKVWRLDARENRFVLTTAGEQTRREMGAAA